MGEIKEANPEEIEAVINEIIKVDTIDTPEDEQAPKSELDEVVNEIMRGLL